MHSQRPTAQSCNFHGKQSWLCSSIELGFVPLSQTKEEIAYEVKDQLTKSMSTFGFMIIQTLVTDIEPDQRVRAAMNEINAASRMRQASCCCSATQKLVIQHRMLTIVCLLLIHKQGIPSMLLHE